jgi:hypothetical protein
LPERHAKVERLYTVNEEGIDRSENQTEQRGASRLAALVIVAVIYIRSFGPGGGGLGG